MVKLLLDRLLGETKTRVLLPSRALIHRENTSVVSNGRKYRLVFAGNEVVLSGRSFLAVLLGWPALYHFVGRLDSHSYSADELTWVQGDLRMNVIYKVFLRIWFGFVSLACLLFSLAVVLKIGKFILYPESIVIGEILAGCGLIVGCILLFVFGVLILKFTQAISNRISGKLSEECFILEGCSEPNG